MNFETKPYRLSRTDLARLAAMEYLRTFWWVVIGIPLFGLIAVIVSQGILQVMGMFALLWPFSIPARAILVTTNSSRLFTGGVVVKVLDTRLEFCGQTPGKSGKPYRMVVPIENVRELLRRGPYLVVRTYRFGIAPIPISAFDSESDVATLAETLAARDT